MSTLVFLEHHGNELLKSSLGVLSKAATLGDGELAGVVVGSGVRPLADEAGEHGATKVYVADDPQLEAPLSQPRVDVLAQLVRDRGVDTVLFAKYAGAEVKLEGEDYLVIRESDLLAIITNGMK